MRQLSAALASDCSILVKAPEETSASPAALIQAFVDPGLPVGAVGLVYRDPAEISSYLIAHPVIRKITFTSSPVLGKQLAALAGAQMTHATLAIGGHAPVIVAEDADVALAAKAMGAAKFRHAGQVCIAPIRFLVHERIKATFTRELVRVAEGLTLGNGLDPKITMGPLANSRRLTAMRQVVKDAVALGATLAAGEASA